MTANDWFHNLKLAGRMDELYYVACFILTQNTENAPDAEVAGIRMHYHLAVVGLREPLAVPPPTFTSPPRRLLARITTFSWWS